MELFVVFFQITLQRTPFVVLFEVEAHHLCGEHIRLDNIPENISKVRNGSIVNNGWNYENSTLRCNSYAMIVYKTRCILEIGVKPTVPTLLGWR